MLSLPLSPIPSLSSPVAPPSMVAPSVHCEHQAPTWPEDLIRPDRGTGFQGKGDVHIFRQECLRFPPQEKVPGFAFRRVRIAKPKAKGDVL